jgi:hypothetical protein
MNLTKQGMKNLKRMMKEPATKRQIKSFNESIGYMEKVNSVKCMCHCHTEMHPVGRMYGCPEMNCIHCKPDKKEIYKIGVDMAIKGKDYSVIIPFPQTDILPFQKKLLKQSKGKALIAPQTDKTTEWGNELRILLINFAIYIGDDDGPENDRHEEEISKFSKFIANELRKEYARGQLDEITAIRQLDAQALDVYRGKLIERIKQNMVDWRPLISPERQEGIEFAFKRAIALIKEEKV